MLNNANRTNRIVFAFVTAGLAFLIAFTVIILINTKALVDKVYYRTILNDAKGLSAKPPIYFKGLEIGRISDFSLNEETNDIEVDFYVFIDYQPKIIQHAVLSGNQNVFLNNATEFELLMPNKLAGYRYDPLFAGSMVPYIDSDVGRMFVKKGIISKPGNSVDSIISSVNTLLTNLQKSDNPEDGSLFKILDRVASMSDHLLILSQQLSSSSVVNETELLIANANQILANVPLTQTKIDGLLSEAEALITELQSVSAQYQDPIGLVEQTTGGQLPEIMTNVNESLNLVKGMIDEVYAERMQLAVTVNTLLKVLNRMDKTLQGVNNNPLLKGGIEKNKPPKGIEMND
ncbi:MCE family protein [Psychrosphaera sp. B3R10]|uniref:MlaD family protein n=1 Tax=unclassified Psychrosphaera TaxID=2641570 RepID=UPI001C0A3A3F|nr:MULTISPECIES: MlaD family protein [unclassified Psychrosphaera]MBU2883434.1 MCE family protein [Psychrosphaera sp. I2R16]MBU2990472.1 MCE family protein [Psychrosphaera sp. B3R10]MDO6719051.1 MlaD family protein [Psychrosphaera sp. 1_MG-2023]